MASPSTRAVSENGDVEAAERRKKVSDFWEELADHSDKYMNWMSGEDSDQMDKVTEKDRREVFLQLPDLTKMDVLEVAAGTGCVIAAAGTEWIYNL